MAEPKIRYDIETGISGEADAEKLAQALTRLGETLESDLGRQAKDAAASLDRLSQAAAAVDGLQALRNESKALSVELAQAQSSVKGLDADLVRAAAATSQFAVAEARARDALSGAKQDLDEQRRALVTLREEFTDAARRTDEYREANKQLQVTISSLRSDVAQKRQALKEAEAASVDAARAELSLAQAYEKAGAELLSVRAAIDDNSAAQAQTEQRLRAASIATEDLTAAQRALVKQTQEATEQARQFVQQQRASEAALRSQEAAQESAARSAAETAQALRDAYGKLGTRSVQELRQEIEQVRAAMDRVKTSGTASGAEISRAFASGESRIKELERAIREATGQLTLADRAANLFRGSLAQISAGNIVADAFGAVVNKLQDMGRAFIDVNVRAENMQRGLAAVYGSSRTAAEQIEFLRKAAGSAGVSFPGISDAFVRFSAATKAANMPLEVTNDLFASVTRAGATLGLSTERVTLVLDALAQMSSKGVVSMEELRQQLGDSLPGALSLTAKGLGVTDQELIKLVESGQLAARDLFPALSKSLKDLHGDTDTLTGAWSRFTNAMTTGGQVVGAAGGIEVMKVAVRALAVAFGVVAVPLQAFVEVLSLATRGIGLFIDVLKGKGATQALAEFEAQVLASATRITTFHEALDQAISTTDASAASTRGAAQAQGLLTSSLLASAQAQATNATATAQAGTAAAGAGNAYVQLLTRLGDTTKAIETNILVSERLAKAKADEGQAALRAAQIGGDAARILEVSAKATQTNADAAERVVLARRAEVESTQRTIAAIQAMGVANGGLREDQAKLIEQLREKLKAQDADLEKSRQARAEAEALAAAQRVAAQAARDNSADMEVYRQRMQDTATVSGVLRRSIEEQERALEVLRGAVERGSLSQQAYHANLQELNRTKEAYERATVAQSEAERLFQDSARDSIALLEQRGAAETAALTIAKAQVSASEARYKTMAAEARASGDLNTAAYAEAQARREHIKVMELELQIQRLQIEVREKALEIQLAAVTGTDDESRAKRAKLEVERELLKAQRELLKVQEEGVKQARAEADAMDKQNASRQSGVSIIGQETDARRQNAQAIDQEAQALERAAEAERKRLRIDKDGFSTDKDGNRIAMGGDLTTRTGIAAFLKSAGVDDDNEARRIAGEFADANGKVSFENNPAQRRYGGTTISEALLNAAERYTFGPTSGAKTIPKEESSRTVTMNINLSNGFSGVVRTDPEGESALRSLLSELERAQGTSSYR